MRWLLLPLALAPGCSGSPPPPTRTSGVVDLPAPWPASQPSTEDAGPAPEPRFVPGEVVVALEEGAAVPAEAAGAACTPAVWADARTVLLRCALEDPRPEATEALVDALAKVPGVRSAQPNMTRGRRVR